MRAPAMHIHNEEGRHASDKVLAGLALPPGPTVPVAAESSEMVQAAPEMLLAAYDGMGSGGGRPGMQAPGRPGGWQRGFGHGHGHRRPSFVGMR